MTLTEYAAQLADAMPPLSDAECEKAARLLAQVAQAGEAA
jgi:hypothetical protein